RSVAISKQRANVVAGLIRRRHVQATIAVEVTHGNAVCAASHGKVLRRLERSIRNTEEHAHEATKRPGDDDIWHGVTVEVSHGQKMRAWNAGIACDLKRTVALSQKQADV